MRSAVDILYGAKARLTKRQVVRNLFGSPPTWPKALLHYKTDPLFNARLPQRYTHTNNWEITEICRLLDRAGFQVDVVDRAEANWTPKDEYAVFLGNGSGRAGWRYAHYATNIPSALKIFYATSPEARLAESQMLDRYAAFERRTRVRTNPMRVPSDIDVQTSVLLSDYIFCFDGNGFASDSYRGFARGLSTISPSTSPAVRFDYTWLSTRKNTSFLCFAGDGFVVKGVDLVVEAFSKMPRLSLHIAGPSSDAGFWKAYESVITASSNIHYEGFLAVSGRRFKHLCATCAFVILPSASEAACTSVATAMRAGLVPITTYSTCIDDGTAGYILPARVNELIDAICDTASCLSSMDKGEYAEKVIKTLRASARYSQAGFAASFDDALHNALLDTQRSLWWRDL